MTIICNTENFVLNAAVTKQSAALFMEGYPHAKDDSWHARGNFATDKEVEETMLKLFESFSDGMIDVDAIMVYTSLSLETAVERTLKPKRASFTRKKRSQRFQTKKSSHSVP